MGPPSYIRSVVDRNVVMRHIPVYIYKTHTHTHTPILTLKTVHFVHVACVHMYVSEESCNKQPFP